MMLLNAASSFDNNIPLNGTDVALEHFSKGPVSHEVRVIPDYTSPLSRLEVVVRDNNIVLPLPKRYQKLSVRERAESLFGEMRGFNEEEWQLYAQMLSRDPVIEENVF